MFNLAVKKFFEKNLPWKVYGNLNSFVASGFRLTKRSA